MGGVLHQDYSVEVNMYPAGGGELIAVYVLVSCRAGSTWDQVRKTAYPMALAEEPGGVIVGSSARTDGAPYVKTS
ncbi:hypothetical protein [Streptomyces sp. NPDC059783]|uniref:hypothetical protein n=1 Tax=Streptomyces sp. NPDC059783 TaxID=3346944 RepID=UPI00365C8E51